MGEMIRDDASNEENRGTAVGRFLARRGVLMMKEFKDIGTMKDLYRSKMSIRTLVLVIAKSASSAQESSHSVLLEQESDGNEYCARLDFDELEELIKALAYIEKLSKRLAQEPREYTELIYSTKDGVEFGLYQKRGETLQTAFITLRPGAFFSIEVYHFQKLAQLLGEAREHLLSKGAEA